MYFVGSHLSSSVPLMIPLPPRWVQWPSTCEPNTNSLTNEVCSYSRTNETNVVYFKLYYRGCGGQNIQHVFQMVFEKKGWNVATAALCWSCILNTTMTNFNLSINILSTLALVALNYYTCRRLTFLYNPEMNCTFNSELWGHC